MQKPHLYTKKKIAIILFLVIAIYTVVFTMISTWYAKNKDMKYPEFNMMSVYAGAASWTDETFGSVKIIDFVTGGDRNPLYKGKILINYRSYGTMVADGIYNVYRSDGTYSQYGVNGSFSIQMTDFTSKGIANTPVSNYLNFPMSGSILQTGNEKGNWWKANITISPAPDGYRVTTTSISANNVFSTDSATIKDDEGKDVTISGARNASPSISVDQSTGKIKVSYNLLKSTQPVFHYELAPNSYDLYIDNEFEGFHSAHTPFELTKPSKNKKAVVQYYLDGQENESLTQTATRTGCVYDYEGTGGLITKTPDGKFVLYGSGNAYLRSLWKWQGNFPVLNALDNYTGTDGKKYKFIRWDVYSGASVSSGVENGTSLDDYCNANPAADDYGTVTARAIYTSIYHVKFNPNNGDETTETDILNGDTIPFPTVTKKGYTLIGWRATNGKDYQSGSSYDVGSDTTFDAIWQENNYTIKYDANASQYTTNIATGTVEDTQAKYDHTVFIRDNAYKLKGYYFTGEWNTKPDGSGTALKAGKETNDFPNLTDEANGTVTIYAQWKARTYHISFKSYKPSKASSEVTGNVPETITYIYDQADSSLSSNTLKLKGWTFTNWNTSSDGSGTSVGDGDSIKSTIDRIIDDNNLTTRDDESTISFFPQWRQNVFYFDFLKNKPSKATAEVTGIMRRQKCLYDDDNNLQENRYALKGWTFKGWNDKPDGSGKAYANKEDVTNETAEDGKIVNLYAQWEQIKITVTFYPNRPTASNNTHNASEQVKRGGADAKAYSYVYAYDSNPSYCHKNTFTLTGWHYTGWRNGTNCIDSSVTEYAPTIPLQTIIDQEQVLENNQTVLSLYAAWTANTYTVRYNRGHNKNDYKEQVCIYDKEYKVQNNIFTMTDDNFRQNMDDTTFTYNVGGDAFKAKYSPSGLSGTTGNQYDNDLKKGFDYEFLCWTKPEQKESDTYEIIAKDKYEGTNEECMVAGKNFTNLAGQNKDNDQINYWAFWNAVPNITLKRSSSHFNIFEGAKITAADLAKRATSYDKEAGSLDQSMKVKSIEYSNGEKVNHPDKIATTPDHIGSYKGTMTVTDKRGAVRDWEFTGNIVYNHLPKITATKERYLLRRTVKNMTLDALRSELEDTIEYEDKEDKEAEKIGLFKDDFVWTEDKKGDFNRLYEGFSNCKMDSLRMEELKKSLEEVDYTDYYEKVTDSSGSYETEVITPYAPKKVQAFYEYTDMFGKKSSYGQNGENFAASEEIGTVVRETINSADSRYDQMTIGKIDEDTEINTRAYKDEYYTSFYVRFLSNKYRAGTAQNPYGLESLSYWVMDKSRKKELENVMKNETIKESYHFSSQEIKNLQKSGSKDYSRYKK